MEFIVFFPPFLERPLGYDRVRNAEIGNKDFELDVLEEAYTTEHWLVRIYKVSRCYTVKAALVLKNRPHISKIGIFLCLKNSLLGIFLLF